LRSRSEWQRSPPGRLNILQEGDLKGAGAGHHYVLEDELVGRRMGLAEEGALAGSREKKESL